VTENNNKEITRKKLTRRLIFIVVYLSILIFLYFFLIDLGINPLGLFIVFVFLYIISIGPLFRQNKRTLYSRLYPDRKRTSSMSQQKIKTAPKKIRQPQPKIFRPVSLDASYNKPLVLKCEKCRNTIPNFVKRCPFCNRQIRY
jgi:hypothetical protein